MRTDVEVNKVSPNFLHDFAPALHQPESDDIFLCCGALRLLEIIDEVERKLNKPVILGKKTSFWHCLRLAGVNDKITAFSRLLRL